LRHRSLTSLADASVGRKTASGQKIPWPELHLGNGGPQSRAARSATHPARLARVTLRLEDGLPTVADLLTTLDDEAGLE
jgi:hypothetical protein